MRTPGRQDLPSALGRSDPGSLSRNDPARDRDLEDVGVRRDGMKHAARARRAGAARIATSGSGFVQLCGSRSDLPSTRMVWQR